MQDRPTSRELVQAVREFLEHDVQTSVEGRTAFLCRVAVNVLAIVDRELESGEIIDASQRARLRELLGADGTTRELTALLARGIRDGTVDDGDEAVLFHVRETVREKLLVANPNYLDSTH